MINKNILRSFKSCKVLLLCSHFIDILNKYLDVDNLWNKRLTEYQDLLASREMFQGDVERVVWWLKQAEIITFPQINPVSDNQQLKENLLKYDVTLNYFKFFCFIILFSFCSYMIPCQFTFSSENTKLKL